MKKFMILGLLLLCGSLVVVAQEVPKVEVFGGYSLFHADTGAVSGFDLSSLVGSTVSIKQSYSGWNGEVQYNTGKYLGFVADVSGHYGQPVSISGFSGLPSAHIYNFLFGPAVSLRTQHFKPFVRGLFGVNRISTTQVSFSDNAFGMGLGGGVDVGVSNRFMLRLGQLDYIYTDHGSNSHQNNFRFSTGLVLGL